MKISQRIFKVNLPKQTFIFQTRKNYTLNNLIETRELNELLNNEKHKDKLSILDCSWFLPTENKKAKELFNKEKIPYSKFFDIDEIADKSIDLPHMFPDETTFIKNVKELDIRKDDMIICYDRSGIFSAPRVWLTLKIFGAKNVAVLNGGYLKWEKESLPIAKAPYNEKITRESIKPSDFDYKFDKSKVRDLDSTIALATQILQKRTNEHLIDARPSPRYKGEVPEPRKSKFRGHIPGALNVFFKNLLDQNSCIKPLDQLIKEFEKEGVDLNNPITLYCGSGVTASVDLFVLALLGKYDQCKIYDGSWSEYGNLDESENSDFRKLNELNNKLKK